MKKGEKKGVGFPRENKNFGSRLLLLKREACTVKAVIVGYLSIRTMKKDELNLLY